MDDLKAYVTEIGIAARRASRQLAALDGAAKIRAAIDRRFSGSGIGENPRRQCGRSGQRKENQLAAPLVERLKLSEKKINAMAEGVRQIAAQVDPVGSIIEGYVRPNGLRIQKVRVPLGVVLFSMKAGPTSPAMRRRCASRAVMPLSCAAGRRSAFQPRIAQTIAASLAESNIDPAAVQLIESTDRALVPHLLKLDKYIDLVIPRGGESLIRAVVAESTIPVLKHYTGNCHVYVDAAACR